MLTSNRLTISEYFKSYKIDPTIEGWDQLETFLGKTNDRVVKLIQINNSKIPLWVGAVARLHLLNYSLIDTISDHWFLEKLLDSNFDFLIRYFRILKLENYPKFISGNPKSLISTLLPFFQFYLGNSNIFVSLNDVKCYDEIKKAKIITEFWKRSISADNFIPEICSDLQDSRTPIKYYTHFFYSYLVKRLYGDDEIAMRKVFAFE